MHLIMPLVSTIFIWALKLDLTINMSPYFCVCPTSSYLQESSRFIRVHVKVFKTPNLQSIPQVISQRSSALTLEQ